MYKEKQIRRMSDEQVTRLYKKYYRALQTNHTRRFMKAFRTCSILIKESVRRSSLKYLGLDHSATSEQTAIARRERLERSFNKCVERNGGALERLNG
jgi:hypothetical protein